jgi:hypothetical protein
MADEEQLALRAGRFSFVEVDDRPGRQVGVERPWRRCSVDRSDAVAWHRVQSVAWIVPKKLSMNTFCGERSRTRLAQVQTVNSSVC